MVFSPLKNHELYVIIWVQQSYNRKPLPEKEGGLQSTANHPFSRGFVWLLQTVGCKSSFVSQQWLWNIVAVRFSINRFFIMQKDLTNSPDLTTQEIEQLANVFPQFVSEWKIDINWLSEYLQWVKVEWERYNLNRYGKSQAKLIAREPSKATLIPDLEQSRNFSETGNMLIEWDNLEVLKLLQNNYNNKVKCIYIDPPYNKDKDFVYRDTWKDSLGNYMRITWQIDEEWDTSTDKEQWGRKHSNWLSMMYPRLYLARKLLRDDGVIFVSIDDDEVHNLRKLMDEVFGEENFVSQITRIVNKSWTANKYIRVTHDFILVYAKNVSEYSGWGFMWDGLELNLKDDLWPYMKGRELNKRWTDSRREDSPSMRFPVKWPNDIDVYPIRSDWTEGRRRLWKLKMKELVENDWIIFEERDGVIRAYEKIRDWSPNIKQFKTLFDDVKYLNANWSQELKRLFNSFESYMDFPKPVPMLKDLLHMWNTQENDIILDFFAWSWTTWHAVMDLNAEDGGDRKYILVQLPEIIKESEEAYKAWYRKISQITRDRLIKAWEKINSWDTGFKYFKLTSSNFHELDSIEVKAWETTSETLLSRLDLELEQPWIKADRNDMDVYYELCIRYGYSLHSKIAQDSQLPLWTRISDTDQTKELLICLLDTITDTYIQALIKTYWTNKTITIICKDEALSDGSKTTLMHYFTNFISL